MALQNTERSPPAKRRGAPHTHRYLFLVLEGARLDAGGVRVALGGVHSLRIGRGEARMLRHAGEATQALEVPDSRMSSTHARILQEQATFVLADTGSTNGTLVNGRPSDIHVLRDGDVIELGQSVFLYREIEEESARGVPSRDSSAMVGSEPGFATLDPGLSRRLERLARLAPSPLPILLLGETGTGKEVAARGLHALSQRPGQFIAVNCGAIPHNLVESHLFGHVRGAFSGAHRDEPGLVRSAQFGTLLLDEIGDLPASSQAALLRVLQEREVQPVGSTRTTKVDVRIVAATHMPIEDLVERGAFRRDLYARLAGYTFTLAPLRERVVDLGLLIAAMLAAGNLGTRHDLRMESGVARALLRHHWPMNVRELEKVLGAACLLAEDGVITAEDLPPSITASLGVAEHPEPVVAPRAVTSEAPADAVAPEVDPDQRALLVALLAEHAGNLSAVARAMRTSRSHVHRLRKRYGIEGKP
jgi:sigma-54 dependent transcriptional regulator, acetoin dehydrogenase operon transcriptional activator AcoR